MNAIQEKIQEILSISEPHMAYIRIATDQELSLEEGEIILQLYAEAHKVTFEEMAFYPNGERVLTPDMFQ